MELILPLLLVLFAGFMFMNARRQRRQFQEQQQMQSSLAAGDRVMTTSGLYGTIVNTAEDTVDIEVAAGITTTWVRQAVRERVKTEVDELDADDDADRDGLTDTTTVDGRLPEDAVEDSRKADGR